MPGFNGTGPRGEGAMTGGGRGFCAVPAGAGRGFRGRRWRQLGRAGRGMGRGRALDWYRIRASQEETIDQLSNEAELLKQELKDVQERIADLQKDDKNVEE